MEDPCTYCNAWFAFTGICENCMKKWAYQHRDKQAKEKVEHCTECKFCKVFEPWDGADAVAYCGLLMRKDKNSLIVDENTSCAWGEWK